MIFTINCCIIYDMSNLYSIRRSYMPSLPAIIASPFENICVKYGYSPTPSGDEKTIKKYFTQTFGQKVITFSVSQSKKKALKPLRTVVVLSGGQAPGGHNVIAGIYDALMKISPESKLYGALGGPDGLVRGEIKELDKNTIDSYRNTGGFDMIGSGRGKITTPEQFKAVEKLCKDNKINSIIIIGGDDSNTNAAHLAEYFMKNDDTGVVVVGCPKTIDGDLKNSSIETSFGFDTATKTYSELIGNIEKDALSAKKYWFFIRLMGRSASHVALECALQTHPNICLIGEEVKSKNETLKGLIDYVADVIKTRAQNGKNYGVCLIPEGIIEFIPEVGTLISELNTLLANSKNEIKSIKKVAELLSPESSKCFLSLPGDIQKSLLGERDPHGNVQVSKIKSEELIGNAVSAKLKKEGVKVSPVFNFFGYEGRSAYPTNFDASYCYCLGYNAVILALFRATGYMSTVQNLTSESENWKLGGVPIVSMFTVENRNGKPTPVIQKALVDLNGAPFKEFEKNRSLWANEDSYIIPGPIQYFGPKECCNSITKTLQLEKS